jgi:hypothetical protein
VHVEQQKTSTLEIGIDQQYNTYFAITYDTIYGQLVHNADTIAAELCHCICKGYHVSLFIIV